MQKKRLCRILTAVWLMAVSAAISFPVCNSFAASEDGAEIQKVYWEGKTARWVANGRFVEYEVELYRDGDRIAKNTVKGSRKDFATHMVRGADYYFRVRGYKNGGGYSDWQESDAVEVERKEDSQPTNVASKVPTAQSSVIRGKNGPYETVKPNPMVESDTSGKVTKPAATNGWQQDQVGRWYQNVDGTYPKNRWLTIDKKKYHFGADGYVSKGWICSDASYYYCQNDGSVLTGYGKKIGEVKYDFSSAGVLRRAKNAKAFVVPDNVLVVDEDGKVSGTWIYENATGKRWYRNPDGTYPKGAWRIIGGKQYCFDADGYMRTGWIKEGDSWFYCDDDGVMLTGEYMIDGVYYKFGPSGEWIREAK